MKKYKIGYTCGVYDLIHVGHLNLFERCKEMCEMLIVGVCDDDYVYSVKNTTPVINQENRLRMVGSLKCVDKAVLIDKQTTSDKMLALSKFNFDVLFSGDDWKGTERYIQTEAQFEKLNVKIEYLPYTKDVSTSLLKEKLNKN